MGRKLSGQVGRRFDTLKAIEKAAVIRPSVELRNEAITALTLADLRQTWRSETPVKGWLMTIDDHRKTYIAFEPGRMTVRRIPDHAEVWQTTNVLSHLGSATLSRDGRALGVSSYVPNSPSGPFLLTICDVFENRVLWQLWQSTNPALIRALDFSVKSNLLATISWSATNCWVSVHDVESGRRIATFDEKRWPYEGIEFNPDGDRVAISSDDGGAVRIRNWRTGELLASLPHPGLVRGLSWHPEGRWLATACADGKAYVWDAERGTIKSTLTGHQRDVTRVRFDPRGDLLATLSWDGSYRFWNPFTGQEIIRKPLSYENVVSVDGRWLGDVSAHRQLTLWTLTVPGEWRLLSFQPNSPPGTLHCQFSPDGQLLASTHQDGTRLWDVTSGRLVAHLASSDRWDVLFEPASQSLLTAGRDGLQRWSLQELPLARETQVPSPTFPFQNTKLDRTGGYWRP